MYERVRAYHRSRPRESLLAGGVLLCRELGLSPGEILQDRAGSWMLDRETKGGGRHV